MVSPEPATEFSQPLRRYRGRWRLPRVISKFKLRMRHLKRLPKDFRGERHVIIARRLPDQPRMGRVRGGARARACRRRIPAFPDT